MHCKCIHKGGICHSSVGQAGSLIDALVPPAAAHTCSRLRFAGASSVRAHRAATSASVGISLCGSSCTVGSGCQWPASKLCSQASHDCPAPGYVVGAKGAAQQPFQRANPAAPMQNDYILWDQAGHAHRPEACNRGDSEESRVQAQRRDVASDGEWRMRGEPGAQEPPRRGSWPPQPPPGER